MPITFQTLDVLEPARQNEKQTAMTTNNLNKNRYPDIVPGKNLRGNVGENQRGGTTCRRNLCSYSGY